MLTAEGDKKHAKNASRALNKSFYVTNHGRVRRKISIAVDPEVYDKFIKTVVEIEGNAKAVGRVLEHLMLKYIEDTSGKSKDMRIRLTTYEKLKKILEYIANKRKVKISELLYSQVTESELKEAIENTIGIDERTIKKYTGLLEKMKIIKYCAGLSPRRIFEVERIP